MESNHIYTGKTLEEELLQLLAKQLRRVPLPIIFAASIIASFASLYTPAVIWCSWLSLTFFLLLARWFVLYRLQMLIQIPIKQQIKLIILLSALQGITYGASLWFFPYFSELERAIQTMLLLSLCTGSVSTMIGYLPFFSAFTIPILIPVSLMWSFSPGYSNNHIYEYVISILVLMYGLVLAAIAKDTFRLFKDSFEIRLQQIDLNQKLQSALKKAEAANRSKTRFLASASHDLRQPIHTLSLFGAALNMQSMSTQCREITQYMNTALQVLASQLDGLLDISKLDANIVQVNSSPMNIRTLLQRLSQEMKPLATEKKLEFQLHCSQDFFIETDTVLLERILRNLISNAIKYTDTGSIKVHTSSQDGSLLIEIQDTGFGISTEDQTLIFEEFYQVSNPERDQSKGIGLGLAIVKRLTEMLDINLSINSKEQCGSNFSLRLPLIASGAVQQRAEVISSLVWKNLTILVVDDEKTVGQGMKTLLESLGCQTIVTDSTASSLKAIQQKIPDIVLADFRLRGQETGIQTINALRKNIPGLPAILISGDTAPDRLREAKASGLSILHKPVMVDTLEQAIIKACYSHIGDKP